MKTKMAILLVLVMLVSLGTCSSSLAASTPDSEKNLYGFDEPVTLKVGYSFANDLIWYNGETSSNNVWVDLYKENNMLLDILYEVDSSQAATKLSASIMSGNYPDFIHLSANELADYANFALTGVIADITDVYEEYASAELKAYLGADDGLTLDSLMINGRLYGIPKIMNTYESAPVMFVRQDWLDNLGLSMPKTMEELKAVAHAFTYNDPDGNGENDTYGLAMDGVDVLTGGIGSFNGFFNGYGAYLGPDGLAFIDDGNGNITWGGTNADGMKQALQLLQEMYKDGTLAKDFITMDANRVYADAGADKFGIWFGPYWGNQMPTRDLWIAGKTYARITTGAIPSGLEGAASKAYIKPGAIDVYMISSKCEHPEALIKIMNLAVQKICYPASQDEYIKYAGGSNETSGWKSSLTNINGSSLKNYGFYHSAVPAVLKGDPTGLTNEQRGCYDSLMKFITTRDDGTLDLTDELTLTGLARYPVYLEEIGSYRVLEEMRSEDRFVISAYNTSPTENMAEYAPTLRKLALETIIKIITGESVDSYDAFLTSWYALGGTEVIADAQAWVDSTK